VVSLLNKFVLLAIILTAANFFTDGFVFQQVDKIDVDVEGIASEHGSNVMCAVAVYVTYPLLFGLPLLPGADDVIVALILGLLTLGILSAVNRPIRKRWKLAIFVLWWLAYRISMWYLVLTIPGCAEHGEYIGGALSPLTPIFMVLAVILVVKIYAMKKH
jgi:hypothetical protein